MRYKQARRIYRAIFSVFCIKKYIKLSRKDFFLYIRYFDDRILSGLNVELTAFWQTKRFNIFEGICLV